jgi:hypothetical protein
MVLRLANFVIENPAYLYFTIPFSIIVLFLLRKKFVKEEQRLFKVKGRRRFVFFLKIAFFMLLMIALSTPYLEYKESYSNTTKIKAIIDNSYSDKLYDIKAVEDTLNTINNKGISLSVEKLDLEDTSSIGSSILNNLAPAENILLVSDGQNNFGPSLESVALFSSSIKSKIFAVNLKNSKDDAGIIIDGPSKVIADVENMFTIRVNEIGNVGKKTVKVWLDDTIILENQYTAPVEIKKSFVSGVHIMKAEISSDERDIFRENNVFYKVISVYSKPKILLVSKADSPISKLYNDFYSIDTQKKIDPQTDLDKYYAVILDDVPGSDLDEKITDKLEEFVSDGNGLFVIGGKESYDWGDYNTSQFMSIMPVAIGKAKKTNDILSLVILMDTGASAGEDISSGISHFDVQKSIVADVIRSISPTNKVALIEANYYLSTLTGLSDLGPKRVQLINDISLIKPDGFSELRFAYKKAHQMLRLGRGSKNIVIITDGNLIPVDQSLTLTQVPLAYDDGIKTFIIGVGSKSDEEFLKSIKELGHGEYFKTDERSKIKLYFGNPEENSADDITLFIYDSNHFITKDVNELGKIYGFNSVYPKSTARMLITSSRGDPVLTVWNYGLGRVAALSTDDGNAWVPDLLQKENSKVLLKTLNWIIEDPERKNDFKVDIPDLRQGETASITVRSKSYPSSEGLSFYETEKGLYQASIYMNRTGIIDILNIKAAVNYKKEYLSLGISKDLPKIIGISGGEMLENTPDIADKIKSLSNVETLKKVDLAWVFMILSITTYLIELLIRRIFEIKQGG